jgi:hypothetical protein
MNSLRRLVIAASVLVIVSALVPMARAADSSDWPTQITFTEPVRVGPLYLTAGTYEFRLNPDSIDRSILMVYSFDKRCWEGIAMGVNAQRVDTSKMTGFTFERAKAEEPLKLEYWFYGNWNHGIHFVYPEAQNTRITQTTHLPATTVAQLGK